MSLRFLSGTLLFLLGLPLEAAPFKLQLPTDNRALFDGAPEQFYMYVYRTFEGETSKPWQGGQYGFVRNMKRTSQGLVATRFHEGIDIRPAKRDSAGRPLDEVRAISGGRVAYVQPRSGASNYGKYVVLEHDWGHGPFFSLYAHLASISVESGQTVQMGQALGMMGYTGAGINRERAHVHLELNLLLSLQFDDWHRWRFGTENKHGIHNGMNMTGLDISRLFVTLQKTPTLSLPEFIRSTPVHYRVTIPRRGVIEIAGRYPWLCKGNHDRPSSSWELSFSATGFPLSIAPSNREVAKPIVTYVRPTELRHEYFTISRLSGTGRRATLTASGQKYIALITGEFEKK